MKRFLLLLALLANQADGQSSATPCYITGSSTACFKPVNTASMAGPASASVSGYLSSTDWSAFNSGGAAGVPATRTISTTAPLTGGGDLSTNRVFAITQAATAANGYLSSTDWNTFNSKQATIGVSAPITLTTATVGITQAATAANGYLSSTDWNTFNSKVSATRSIATTAPLTGGGDFSADRTFAITQAATAANGYLSSTDWNTFNSKQATITQGNLTEATSAVLTIVGGTSAIIGSGTTIAVTKSDTTHNGYLSSTDWTTFNSKVSTTRAINTTAPITGGGDLSSDRTIAISAASSSAAGSVSFESSGTTSSATFSGARTINNVNVYWARVGNVVTAQWDRHTGTSCSAGTLSSTGVLPSGFRPVSNSVINVVFGQDNAADKPIVVSISSAGTMTFQSQSGGNFTNGANCGFYEGSTSFTVN